MRKIYCLLIPLFLLASISGAAEWVSLTGSALPPSVDVLESSGSNILLNYQLNGFEREQIQINGTDYDFITIGESRLWDKGNPDLPRLCHSIIIPDDALMQAQVISSQYTDIEGVLIAPSKGHILRSIDPATVPYEFGEIYQQDVWYPEQVVEVRDPYIMRDFRGQVVEVNAFQYNPAKQTLRVYTSLTIEVNQVGIGGANVFERTQEFTTVDPQYKWIYERRFINMAQMDYTPVEEQGPMLVITYDAFHDAVQPLVDWKNQKGVPTTLVDVSTIGNNATAIKNYITNIYQTDGLTYVLLVGDAAQVATPSGGEDPTYGMILGNDAYPELFVGRFSSENLDHVSTQVERTIEYERDPQAGADWYHKGIGVASNQGPGHHGEYDDEHIDLIRDQLMHFWYTEVDQVYDPFATQSMISNALNDGRSILNYCGHGSTTSWGTTGFSNTNVNNLTNDNMLGFMTSVACLNGNFASSTCFAETWLRATHNGEPTGAIGFWASSISQSWNPPMDAQDEVVDLLTPELKTCFGAMCFNGAMLMVDLNGSTGENEAKHWCVFGDPSVQVRTDTPSVLSVSHNTQIDPNNPTFEVVVSGEEGALCAIAYNGELYGSDYTNSAGLAVIDITPGTLPPGYVDLTVTAFNGMPYIVTLPVVPGGPDTWPPLIAHIRLENTTSSGPYTVEATIMDYSGVASASVFYSIDGINFDEAAMTNTVGDTWEGDIAGQAVGTVIDYYIEATDMATTPNTGSSDTWSFAILGVLFFDDMEGGVGGWTHSEVTPTWIDQWHMSTQTSQSGTHAWKFGDTGTGNYADLADGGLVSPTITIGSDCELTFWHRIDAEASGAYPDSAYDGGVVEISVNSGAWSVLPMSYTHEFRTTSGGGNPYTGPFGPGTPGFSGSNNWTEANADLSMYMGDIQLRFRFGSDAGANEVGWFIDDVEIIGLPTGTVPLMNIDLTYVSGSPVPATGGDLIFDVYLENEDNIALIFDAWLETSYEGGAPTTLVQRAFTDFQPGWIIDREDMFFPVPGGYAAGNYTFTGKVGIHPSVAWDESGFPYTKSGVANNGVFVPFLPASGMPNPFDVITTADRRHPACRIRLM